jgi:hypothetical protein
VQAWLDLKGVLKLSGCLFIGLLLHELIAFGQEYGRVVGRDGLSQGGQRGDNQRSEVPGQDKTARLEVYRPSKETGWLTPPRACV